jgi:hypothetical protein
MCLKGIFLLSRDGWSGNLLRVRKLERDLGSLKFDYFLVFLPSCQRVVGHQESFEIFKTFFLLTVIYF